MTKFTFDVFDVDVRKLMSMFEVLLLWNLLWKL